MKTKAQKQKDLEALADQFQKASAAMLVSFKKMTVPKDQELRNQLREAGSTYSVVKNTLARKALAGTAFEPVGPKLKGPLVLAFSKDDPGAAARVIKAFAKDNEKLVATLVSLGGDVLSAKDLEKVASLPTRAQALSQLLGVLKAPIQKLVGTIAAPNQKLVRTIAAVRDAKPA